MSVYGVPGISGLGQCALCGESFLAEIILGKTIQRFSVAGCGSDLVAHKDCLNKYASKDFPDLPEKSPLKQAWEDAKSASDIKSKETVES